MTLGIDWNSLEALPGTRTTAGSHVNQCEQSWRDCPICRDWLEELIAAYHDGRIAVEGDPQPTLDEFGQ